MFNFFKKKNDQSDDKLKRTVEVMQESLKKSFENIKQDFAAMDKHNEHFYSKHESHEKKHKEHDEKLQKMHERLLILESMINRIGQAEDSLIQIDPEIETEETNTFEGMSEVSQKICYILAALAQENKELVTLKMLAEEMYPDKEYSTIRSTISQYTTELEELGFAQKKKKGKHVYIKSTEKNPYLGKKIVLKKKVRT
ncbi:hypothetical protein J4438_03255 [Candidatus Woesearchaeota archaeon]|nr:hypothetical protein [Candidatus Woesearchaeota archaeon]